MYTCAFNWQNISQLERDRHEIDITKSKIILSNMFVQPFSVSILNDKGTVVANDDGAGGFTGSFSGKIKYSTGTIENLTYTGKTVNFLTDYTYEDEGGVESVRDDEDLTDEELDQEEDDFFDSDDDNFRDDDFSDFLGDDEDYEDADFDDDFIINEDDLLDEDNLS